MSAKGSRSPATTAPALDEGIAGLELGMLAGHVGPTVRVIRNLLANRVIEAFTPFGLSPAAFSMIVLIRANDGCSQSDLAREMALDKSAVVPILDQLEARGYIARRRSAADRRRHELSLTEAGIALHDQVRRVARTVEQPIRDVLSADELADLLGLLRRVRTALESDRTD